MNSVILYLGLWLSLGHPLSFSLPPSPPFSVEATDPSPEVRDGDVWLGVMRVRTPRLPAERLAGIAHLVSSLTRDPLEQSLLLTISLYETTWGRRGIPFGVSSLRGTSVRDYAGKALKILRRARRMCPTIAGALGHYHHGGSCRPDPYSVSESRTAENLLVRFRRARNEI